MRYFKRYMVTSSSALCQWPLAYRTFGWEPIYLQDILPWYLRMMGKDVGIHLRIRDEHGAAITIKALKENGPQEVVDQYHALFEKKYSGNGHIF